LSRRSWSSTYPLKSFQLKHVAGENTQLKDKALTDAALKQPWDASIQAMVVLPMWVKRWPTTSCGRPTLETRSYVAQSGRDGRGAAHAQEGEGQGRLASNAQQSVETKVVENKDGDRRAARQPEVVYVPAYSPVVVYGPPIYSLSTDLYYPITRRCTRRSRGREPHDLVRRSASPSARRGAAADGAGAADGATTTSTST
jgi:hypothetical protein